MYTLAPIRSPRSVTSSRRPELCAASVSTGPMRARSAATRAGRGGHSAQIGKLGTVWDRRYRAAFPLRAKVACVPAAHLEQRHRVPLAESTRLHVARWEGARSVWRGGRSRVGRLAGVSRDARLDSTARLTCLPD